MRLAEVILQESQIEYDPQPVPGTTEHRSEYRNAIDAREETVEWAEANRQVLTHFIRKHCGPWLSHADGRAAYRGVGKFDGLLTFLRRVRADRAPRDSTPDEDAWFEFVLRAAGSGVLRSNALFVTGQETVAYIYGWPFRVYPMGPIRYAWLPGVSDWGALVYLSNRTQTNSWIDPQRVMATPEFQTFLQHMSPAQLEAVHDDGGAEALIRKSIEGGPARGFSVTDPRIYDPERIRRDVETDRGLARALRTGSEIMVSCEQALYLHPVVDEVIRGGL